MRFESEEYMMDHGGEAITEDQYPFLVNDIIAYIDEIKKKEKNSALIDIIMDYAFKNGIDVEAVGDAISGDVYFKSFIEKDCQLRRIFRSPNDQARLDEW